MEKLTFKQETYKYYERMIKPLIKIWILYFLISAVAYYIQNLDEDEMTSLHLFVWLSFQIMNFSYVYELIVLKY